MLANYHTHSVFSDGKNTPEEIVQKALEKGFDALGFSDHVLTPYDLSYCLRDTEGYIQEIRRLKKKYEGKIELYLGVEEDYGARADRRRYDYIIGSAHYVFFHGKAQPIDFNLDTYLTECLGAFDGDALRFAEAYYKGFCDYLIKRKPDIIGHFDLVTKFDELDGNRLLNDERYHRLAERYLGYAMRSNGIFEVNTGAIFRGIRKSPYPHERLLYALKKQDGKVILSSDCHRMAGLDCAFEETKALLRSVGFQYVYVLYQGEWQKEWI